MRFVSPVSFVFSLAAATLVVSCTTKGLSSAAPKSIGPAATSASSPASLQVSKPAPKPLSRAQAVHLAILKEQDAALTFGLRGQLQRVSMPYSFRLKRKITAWVYLPPGYEQTSLHYPVAYILHGAPGEVRDCFVNARVHRVAEAMIEKSQIAPLILVGWDGEGPGGPADATDYLNRRDGYAMEDFMVRELVPWVDETYRTIADARSRALIGFSAGGYGAANMGLKHPDLWRVMASHSGFFDADDDAEDMVKILGPKSIAWDANSPILLAGSLRSGVRLHFYMDVGRDDSLLHEFKKMEAKLKARNVDFEAHIFAGAHTWDYLSQHYRDSLRFADERWKEMNEPGLPAGKSSH